MAKSPKTEAKRLQDALKEQGIVLVGLDLIGEQRNLRDAVAMAAAMGASDEDLQTALDAIGKGGSAVLAEGTQPAAVDRKIAEVRRVGEEALKEFARSPAGGVLLNLGMLTLGGVAGKAVGGAIHARTASGGIVKAVTHKLTGPKLSTFAGISTGRGVAENYTADERPAIQRRQEEAQGFLDEQVALGEIDLNDPLVQQALQVTGTSVEELMDQMGIEDFKPTNPEGVVFEGLADGVGQAQIEEGTRPTENLIPIQQKFAQLFNLDRHGLQDMQTRLFASGFYPDNVRFEDIDWGNPDDQATQQAWRAAIEAASFRVQAGQRITVEQMLDRASELDPEEAKKEPVTVTLSNPSELSTHLDRVALSIAGREATNTEKQMFVSLMQTLERQFQQQYASAQQATTGVTTLTNPPSAQVAAEEFLEREAPQDVQGMSGAGAYRKFLTMLQAGGPSAA